VETESEESEALVVYYLQRSGPGLVEAGCG